LDNGALALNAYTSFKPAWHIDRIADLRAGRDAVPTHVQLIISDLCNQDCHFCAYRSEQGFSSELFGIEGNKNPARFIPTDKCKEIIDDCAAVGVKAMQFTGGGEPTVHPDHLEIIGYAQQLGLGTSLVTNGVRLKDHEVFRKLDWLRISLDAGSPTTYERTRKSKMWSKVLQHMKLVGTFEKPFFGVGYVVTPENFDEIVEGCALALEAGARYIRFSAVFSTEGSKPYAEIYPTIKARIDVARRMFASDEFQVIDLFGDRLGDLDEGRPDYSFCGYQQFTLYIGGNQKVYTCCTNSYTRAGEIGDLKTMRFADFLKTHRRFDFDARNCHHCQFHKANRVINYLMDPAPLHVDFV
jgi:MoaA/NifB/PqqE/SkfB family radical SAM enzyme